MVNSIPDLIVKNYRKFKKREILFDENGSINFEDLVKKSLRFSTYLKKSRFKKR